MILSLFIALMFLLCLFLITLSSCLSQAKIIEELLDERARLAQTQTKVVKQLELWKQKIGEDHDGVS